MHVIQAKIAWIQKTYRTCNQILGPFGLKKFFWTRKAGHLGEYSVTLEANEIKIREFHYSKVRNVRFSVTYQTA